MMKRPAGIGDRTMPMELVTVGRAAGRDFADACVGPPDSGSLKTYQVPAAAARTMSPPISAAGRCHAIGRRGSFGSDSGRIGSSAAYRASKSASIESADS